MSPYSEIPVVGTVNTLTGAFTRKESPSVFAPVADALPAGSGVSIQAAVLGDAVQGNPHWYRINEDTYIWAGACTRIDPYPAFPENTRTKWTAVVFEVR
ncbi:SH3 domain-containing protein [Enterobacteriaceae bacterium H4N4]|uniref:SH3 domain-containing protein n=1 Tax=Silvania confinis TaxID=2926470 RepID=A0A9J6QA98_9ENTR|nr:SH3 domain-containing protein [Silvania confinis]MCU6669463.1 SH3 domain-containing protein [Silvania confinis]